MKRTGYKLNSYFEDYLDGLINAIPGRKALANMSGREWHPLETDVKSAFFSTIGKRDSKKYSSAFLLFIRAWKKRFSAVVGYRELSEITRWGWYQIRLGVIDPYDLKGERVASPVILNPFDNEVKNRIWRINQELLLKHDGTIAESASIHNNKIVLANIKVTERKGERIYQVVEICDPKKAGFFYLHCNNEKEPGTGWRINSRIPENKVVHSENTLFSAKIGGVGTISFQRASLLIQNQGECQITPENIVIYLAWIFAAKDKNLYAQAHDLIKKCSGEYPTADLDQTLRSCYPSI